jgi:flagellar motor switch protein FliN/FliY
MTIANEIELEPLSQPTSDAMPLAATAWPFLGAVKIHVAVRVGEVETSVSEIMQLKQGSVLALDRLVDEPLDVLVDQHVVARGVLVAVGEHFGVRITEAAIAPAALAPR